MCGASEDGYDTPAEGNAEAHPTIFAVAGRGMWGVEYTVAGAFLFFAAITLAQPSNWNYGIKYVPRDADPSTARCVAAPCCGVATG